MIWRKSKVWRGPLTQTAGWLRKGTLKTWRVRFRRYRWAERGQVSQVARKASAKKGPAIRRKKKCVEQIAREGVEAVMR